MRESLTFRLGSIFGNLQQSNSDYYHVQRDLSKLMRIDDKRGVIKYAFYKWHIYPKIEVVRAMRKRIANRSGHEFNNFEKRQLIEVKNYYGAWLEMYRKHLSDGSIAYHVQPMNREKLMDMINFINSIYLKFKRNDVSQKDLNSRKKNIKPIKKQKIIIPF